MTLEAVFLKVLSMSAGAVWFILAAAALRPLLTRAPKSARCLMWALVGVRLVCPFSVKSALSLLPAHEVIPMETVRLSPAIQTGVPALDGGVDLPVPTQIAAAPGESGGTLQALITAGAWVWLAGMGAMVLYFAVSTLLLRRRVAGARRGEEGIWESEDIPSPFVFGLLRPRIYLPAGLDGETRRYVLAHERAHLRRRDNLTKPLAFLILAVHWFDPLVWLAYALLTRDIELACDERVLRELGPGAKKPYSQALLAAVTFHRRVSACPVAFGEGRLKGRVKNVLRWKKPVVWATAASFLLCAALAVCFLTDPREEVQPDTDFVSFSGGNWRLNVSESGKARISVDTVGDDRGREVWQGEDFDRFCLWSPYPEDRYAALIRDGEPIVVDLETLEEYDVTLGPYLEAVAPGAERVDLEPLFWVGRDALLLRVGGVRETRSMALYTVGAECAHVSGGPLFYRSLFGKISDPTAAGTLPDALSAVFDLSPNLLLNNLSLENDETEEAVRQLLVSARSEDLEGLRSQLSAARGESIAKEENLEAMEKAVGQRQ